jgi:TolB-like protein/Flp pilus assembly protein TadD/predicted Ser/Thr protein kinase
MSQALDRPAGHRREFVRESCGGDEDLRIEVESLLPCHEEAEGSLTLAPRQLAAELLREQALENTAKNGTTLGRYQVVGELATGGMGVIYAAYDPELCRKVALKLMRPETSAFFPVAQGQTRLLREARAMAQLSHPNVVAVHDVGTAGDSVFIAMEHVEGTTLSHWLEDGKRPWREVLSIFLQAGRGLAAAHAAGILHRDFKPENVLVGKDGRARVTDFGLARVQPPNGGEEIATGAATAAASGNAPESLARSATLTEPGKFMGTPGYMAPEQLTGQPATEKTDQFSFCVALYQGLYGEPPFEGETIASVLSEMKQGPRLLPESSSIPAELGQLILRGLSFEPADRHASMDALLDALERQKERRLQLTPIAGSPKVKARLVVACGIAVISIGVTGLYLGAGQARLSPAQKEQLARKPTQSAEAHGLYLRALEYANRPGYEPSNFGFAERLFRQAIQIDPTFALARARLALIRMMTYYFVDATTRSVAEEAKAEAEESLRIQPELPDGHLALGLYHYWARRDFDRALKELEKARGGVPGEALSFIGAIARRRGRFDEAIRNEQEALELDPRSPIALMELAASLTLTRRYQEADQLLNRALTIAPDFLEARTYQAFVHELWKGESDLAQEHLRTARGQSQRPSNPYLMFILMHHPREALLLVDSLESESMATIFALYPKVFLYALAHEALGEAERARQEYEAAVPLLETQLEKSLDRAYQRTILARAYAGVGRKEDALREARRAVELLPISKDAVFGPGLEADLAAVEARVGEKDAAIERLRYLLSIPSYYSAALLRLDLTWAPLRNDPHFRKLAELGPVNSLVVLPFINAGGDAEMEYLSDGIAETLINNLSQIPELKVIARNTAFGYKGKAVDLQKLGRALAVDTVLSGRVQQRGDTLVIHADLVNVLDGSQLWGEKYNRKFTDLLAVEEEIAKAISDKLRPRLSSVVQRRVTKRSTDNLEAYQLYLRGRYFWNMRTKGSLSKGIEHFQQAIELDRHYALAYAGLADSYQFLAGAPNWPREENVAKAEAAAKTALAIDDELAEAHASLGLIKMGQWDWINAEKQLRRAIELNPSYAPAHNWYGIYWGTMAHAEQAAAEFTQAQQLDPTSAVYAINLGSIFCRMGQYDRGIAQLQVAEQLNPKGAAVHAQLATCHWWRKMYQEAIAEFEKELAINPTDQYPLSALAQVYARLGNKDRALSILNQLKERDQAEDAALPIAMLYTELKDKESAFEWLEKAYQRHSGGLGLISLKGDTEYDSLRSDPRFADLLRRMGFPP